MAYLPLQSVLERAGLATPAQFRDWSAAWRKSEEAGTAETQLAFFAREAGLTDEQFLQKLAATLSWPFVELPKLTIPPEVRKQVSTKTAFQFSVIPTQIPAGENGGGPLQIATHNPFDPAMQAAVQFDARGPVQFALATRGEIEKALKKYYGVGAETLDEMGEDDPLDLEIASDREITGDDQDASVIKFVNQVIWEAFKDRATDIHFEPSEDEETYYFFCGMYFKC